VVILDNIGRLLSPLPGAAQPFYLIHDLIPLEMTGRFVRRRLGWLTGFRWFLSSRLYRWRLRRVLFAPGARFGYISKATELSAVRAFGERALRGAFIGPMMVPLGDEATSSPPDREVMTLASAQRYVLALGTGDPKKGLDSLLMAWRHAGVSDQLRLVLFGSSWKGKGRRWIDATIRELGVANVAHVGPVSDATLAALYRNAAAFVFPSYFEGLGLPPAEFCLAGDGPLIVRDIPALREIYGDVAHLFASDDELASLLRSLADEQLAPLVPPTSRRETLRARLDSEATFARLWQAIQGPAHP
jgi:glycosyltransferase involved in cell wall biosynthesis